MQWWETIEKLDNIETMEKAKIDSPINIIARKIDQNSKTSKATLTLSI